MPGLAVAATCEQVKQFAALAAAPGELGSVSARPPVERFHRQKNTCEYKRQVPASNSTQGL